MADFTEFKRQALEKHLRRHIEGEVRFDLASRRLYSTDASIYQIQPLGVIIPRTVADLRVSVQIAGELQVPITARGGGTSLSGQSIGPGVILDCSKYLNAILVVDPMARMARVQPGVVLDQLNQALASYGLQFGPDVSTSSRANLGGMIGNNSAGSHSIVYGKTADHVRWLSAILSDGSRAEFGPVDEAEWTRRAGARTLEGTIYRAVRQIVRAHAEEIRRRFPRILRRVSGYNLDLLLADSSVNNEGAAALRGLTSPAQGPALTHPAALGGLMSPAQGPALTHPADLRGLTSPAQGPALHHSPLTTHHSPLTTHHSPQGLVPLIVGSEGTLAVVTEAELGLVPRPRARGLLLPHFSSLGSAMDALAACLEFQPSAVELMDRMLLDLARDNLSLREAMKPIEGRPAALFMVEFSGDDPAEVADRIERLSRRLAGVNGLTAVVPALEPAVRDPLWNLRSGAVPLLLGVPGDQKPVTFVEDTAVTPERLPEFVARFQELLRRHRTTGAFYGHASVGCLHIRPLLNLKKEGDVERMRHIAEDVVDLVLEFGGALSGEHGDGLARSEWNRKMFGDTVYQAFRQVKHAFDPRNLLNPGKVVEAPAMTENLRYGPDYSPTEPATLFDYKKQEGFVRSIEMCNGSGVCRKLKGGTMCPSFRATRDEKDSTRGRANALRLALTGEQRLGAPAPLHGQWLYDVLDLCLMCKACKSECPSNVDMAKLKSEFLHLYYQGRARPLGQLLMGRIHELNRLAAKAAPLVNFFQRRWLSRWLMEKILGIDRRRSLPTLYLNHFRRWFARHVPHPSAGRSGRVLLLDDCFTTYNEPAVGRAAVKVLEHAGYAVELADLPCCGRPMISKGFLDQAHALIQKEVPRLARRVAEGVPLLGLEPSCLLAIKDEWPELKPGPETQSVAAAAELADGWLARQAQAGRCELALAPRAEKCLLHGHCHQKALLGVGGTVAALKMVPQLNVIPLETGCCGMAGSFGFEREHYDLSVAIANLELLPALEADPDATVIAPGTSCRHQIKDLAGRRALHPLELLAQQIDN